MKKLVKIYFIIFFLIIFSPLAQANAPFAQSLATCPPPEQNSSIKELVDWVETIDNLKNKYLRKKESLKDLKLPSGTILAGSCIEKIEPKIRDKVISNLNDILHRTYTQSYWCEKALGLTSASEVISILRRTKLTCNEKDPKRGAANYIFSYRPFVSPFAKIKTSYDRSYLVDIPLDALTRKRRDSAEEISTYFFHEGIHSTSNNNKTSHQHHVEIKEKSQESCENSYYEDLIYFHSICFPRAGFGEKIQKIMLNCPEVCERALTKSNPESTYKLGKAGLSSLFSSAGIGPDLTAKPKTAIEAKLMCNRIKITLEVAKKVESDLIDTIWEIKSSEEELIKLTIISKR